MKLLINQQDGITVDLNLLNIIASAASQVEGISIPCYAALELCDDAKIHKVNLQQRQVDASTDVLSFPTVEYPVGGTAGQVPQRLQQEWDTELGGCFLGEIFISVPHAEAQALAYGHSFQRELGYLLAHGLMHLCGYDHQNEQEKKVMREQEEAILLKADEKRLLDAARQALKQAYVPYSNYRVGAALLGVDGKIYTGCNVENASFGLTNCGERTAVFKAVSEGCTQFKAIAIAANGFSPWPCGACRQVLSEFCADIPIFVTWDDTHVEKTTLQDLLPHSFSPASGATDAIKKGQ